MTKKTLQKNETINVKQHVTFEDKWIVLLCAAILITVPLAFSRISYDQFDTVKLALLRILVAGTFIFWAKKNWTKSEPIIWSWRELLLASFLLILFLSTLFSIDVTTSVLGTYKRYEGLLTFITYLTLYFVVVQVIQKKKQLRLLIEITSIVGGIVALYGILQVLGLDFFKWADTPEVPRSFSTFGNADLLAGYLVLALPCAIAAYLNDTKRRWLHMFMVLFIIACLYTSLTRGSWIGAFTAVICFAVMLGWKTIKERWREIAIISAPLIIIMVSLIAYSSSQSINVLSRFKFVYDFKNSGGDSRIEIWKAGLKMIEDRPFLGQGPDTFRYAAQHYETKAKVQMTNGAYVSDNAHNYFIQLAASIGPIAAILIFVFFGSWVVRSVKVKRKIGDDNENRILISGVIAAVVGYLVNMIFGISIVGASSVFWLLMAVVTGYTRKVEPSYNKKKILEWSNSLKNGLVVSIGILTVVNASIAASMYAGEIYLVKALVASNNNDFNLSSENFDKAATFYPGNGRYMSEKGQMYQRLVNAASMANDKQALAQYMQESVTAFEKAIETEPLEVDYKVFLAVTYGNMGQLEEAKSALDVALDRRPYSVPAHLYYGIFEQQLNNNENALKHYEDAVDLSPTKAYPDIYLSMSDLYKKAGNTKKSAAYKTAAKYNKPVSQY